MMLTDKNILSALLWILLFLTSCLPSEEEFRQREMRQETPLSELSDVESAFEDIELDDEDYAYFLDEIASDPYDPDLGSNVLGVSDEVLLYMDPVEVYNTIVLCRSFAERKVGSEPRYLYQLGRAAYFHGYLNKSIPILEKASNKGSAGAPALLAEICFLELNDREKAQAYFETALDRDYQKDALNELFKYNENYVANNFNYGVLFVKAMNNSGLTQKEQSDLKMAGTIINNFLWELDALWIAEDSEIFMNLEPAIDLKKILKGIVQGEITANGLEQIRDKVGVLITDGKKHMVFPKETQDARHLVLMYNEDPEMFWTVYNAIMKVVNA